MAKVVFPPEVIRSTINWIGIFAYEWRSEIPMRIHGRDENGATISPDGSPAWSSEFSRWIDSGPGERGQLVKRNPLHTNSPERTRITQAFRKLRRQAHNEFLVAYFLCVLEPLSDPQEFETETFRLAKHLTARAIRLGLPDRFTEDDVLILAVSAMEKLARWA